MKTIKQTGQRLAGLAVGLCLAGGAMAQTASEITPESLAPELQRLNGAVVFTGQAGTQAPPGSEAIGITLSGVDLADALPQLAAANAAFVTRLTRGRVPVSELFDATADLEAAYADAGYVLSRVVLTQQSLRDGGRLRVVVVNGFIEEVDTTAVPERTRARIEQLTGPLVGKRNLTRRELERQLLLAGDAPGTALRSALGAGQEAGGAVIALEPEFRPVTGFVGFGNPTGSELGGFSLNAGVEFNSPLKFGETFYLRASGSLEEFFSSDPRSRILAAGVVVPLGFSGLTVNAEVTASDTTPDNAVTSTRSNFDRQSLRLIYPFVRSRDMNINGQVSLDRQVDTQDDVSGAAPAPIYKDEIVALRLGGDVSLFHENESVTQFGGTLSKGLDAFGARTAAEATASGLSLSRMGADADFTKLALFGAHRRALSETLALSFTGRAQLSFGDALLTSEQFTMVGAQELSSFDSGSLRGDSGWVVRAEVSTQTTANFGPVPVLLSPYAFVGAGSVHLEQPTAVERSRTNAHVYGVGLDIFAQTESSFRSNTVRLEIGKGERDDGSPDDERFSITANFRF